jgi:hypothetical protein
VKWLAYRNGGSIICHGGVISVSIVSVSEIVVEGALGVENRLVTHFAIEMTVVTTPGTKGTGMNVVILALDTEMALTSLRMVLGIAVSILEVTARTITRARWMLMVTAVVECTARVTMYTRRIATLPTVVLPAVRVMRHRREMLIRAKDAEMVAIFTNRARINLTRGEDTVVAATEISRARRLAIVAMDADVTARVIVLILDETAEIVETIADDAARATTRAR